MEKETQTMQMPNYLEYIFQLIYITENLVMLNKNEDLFKFINKCKELYANGKVVSIFDGNTLISYDATLRLFANAIFERVPVEEGIKLNNIPSFEQFKKWFASLEDIDVFAILYFLNKRGYISLSEEDKFEFIINVLFTLRVV